MYKNKFLSATKGFITQRMGLYYCFVKREKQNNLFRNVQGETTNGNENVQLFVFFIFTYKWLKHLREHFKIVNLAVF